MVYTAEIERGVKGKEKGREGKVREGKKGEKEKGKGDYSILRHNIEGERETERGERGRKGGEVRIHRVLRAVDS